jgi:uncharacterized membrane protein
LRGVFAKPQFVHLDQDILDLVIEVVVSKNSIGFRGLGCYPVPMRRTLAG